MVSIEQAIRVDFPLQTRQAGQFPPGKDGLDRLVAVGEADVDVQAAVAVVFRAGRGGDRGAHFLGEVFDGRVRGVGVSVFEPPGSGQMEWTCERMKYSWLMMMMIVLGNCFEEKERKGSRDGLTDGPVRHAMRKRLRRQTRLGRLGWRKSTWNYRSLASAGIWSPCS